ncbi:MAG: hypothetical protein AAGK21_10680 [Bacteroidota bacterium]
MTFRGRLLLVATVCTMAACQPTAVEPEMVTASLAPTPSGTPAASEASIASGAPGAHLDPTAAAAMRPTTSPSAGWDTLWTALAETPMGLDGMVRSGPFPPAVAAWNDADLDVTGYMLPLDTRSAPQRFLLVGVPLVDCAFCIPHGPAGAIEVLSPDGVPSTYEPITLRGRFQVLDADPNGLLFRLTDAALR